MPRLKEVGWDDDQIIEHYRITNGRVLGVGKKHCRKKHCRDTLHRADYVVEYEPAFPIVVVEAKRSFAIPGRCIAAGEAIRVAARRAVLVFDKRQRNRRGRQEHRHRARPPGRLSVTRHALGALSRMARPDDDLAAEAPATPFQPSAARPGRVGEGAALLPAHRHQPHGGGHPPRRRGTGTHDPRSVLAAVFKETHNRMLSGYLLRDVVNKVNEINFASSDDIHTMAHLYESMLREVRDAAGDSGEFYTVVRLPDGVFEPYTAIRTNLLFFDETGPTKEIWFYKVRPPDGRKKYSKTRPMLFEEFAGCRPIGLPATRP